jgi:hypothetical protein
MARTLASPGLRGLGAQRLALCLAMDFVAACVFLFLVAMFVSPFLGI